MSRIREVGLEMAAKIAAAVPGIDCDFDEQLDLGARVNAAIGKKKGLYVSVLFVSWARATGPRQKNSTWFVTVWGRQALRSDAETPITEVIEDIETALDGQEILAASRDPLHGAKLSTANTVLTPDTNYARYVMTCELTIFL